MYRYDEFDHDYVRARVSEFRDQTQRRIDGALTEDEYKPLRLMNGLYLQLHAYMLRVAIPYGTLNSRQMRTLAMIAERWDEGYGHFTTRQNIQYNWTKLTDVGDILDALADVEMHAIQTSGNCIRNVTADHFAGAAADEIEDPRPTAELIRQWSTAHPEFAFLPRKFKVAVTGSPNDRAVTKAHDIGLRMLRNDAGESGYEVIVGGGLGRTPMIGKVMRDFLPKDDLLPYLEAILRVYNLHGRRDNKYKARIKILVHETGIDDMRAQVEAEFERQMREEGGPLVAPDPEQVARIAAYFSPPKFEAQPDTSAILEVAMANDAALKAWVENNTAQHRATGHAIVTMAIKGTGEAPGDATTAQMRAMADLGERYSHDELRISHEQNVILPHAASMPAVTTMSAMSAFWGWRNRASRITRSRWAAIIPKPWLSVSAPVPAFRRRRSAPPSSGWSMPISIPARMRGSDLSTPIVASGPNRSAPRSTPPDPPHRKNQPCPSLPIPVLRRMMPLSPLPSTP